MIGLILTLLCYGSGEGAQPEKAPGFALVELYTSQGCSSCPAADRVLADWFEEAREGVFLLSFHVDYWNRLGWRDPYSQAVFSQRQRAYAAALAERVYTPQMIVNGRHAFVGSQRKAGERWLRSGLAEQTEQGLELTVADGFVNWRILGDLTPGTWINVAFVSQREETEVPRGENSGKKLVNVAVVRDFYQRKATVLGRQPLAGRGSLIVVWITKGQFGPVLGITAQTLPVR